MLQRLFERRRAVPRLIQFFAQPQLQFARGFVA